MNKFLDPEFDYINVKIILLSLVLFIFITNYFTMAEAGSNEKKSTQGVSGNYQENSLGAYKKQLEEVNRALEKSRSQREGLLVKTKNLDVDIKDMRRRLILSAKLIQDHEHWVRALKEKLLTLQGILKEKKQSLKSRRKRNGAILLGLYRVSQYPPEALLIRPVPPGDAVRSAVLLRGTISEFQREIVSLRKDLNLLRKAKKEAKQRRSELSLVKQELQSQRKVMRTLIGRKSRLRRRALAKSDQTEKRLEALAQQARSIKELVANLEKTRLSRGVYWIHKDAESNNRKRLKKNDIIYL